MDIILTAIGTFVELVQAATNWYNKIGENREKRAANVLLSTGIIVAGIRGLDNSIQKLFGYISLGVDEIKQEHREILITQINEFARENIIHKRIKINIELLKNLNLKEIENSGELINKIIKCANEIISVLVAGSSPFESKEQLNDFLKIIREKKGFEERERLNRICDDILSLYDQQIIAEAENAFAGLSAMVLNKYPNIPYPTWI